MSSVHKIVHNNKILTNSPANEITTNNLYLTNLPAAGTTNDALLSRDYGSGEVKSLDIPTTSLYTTVNSPVTLGVPVLSSAAGLQNSFDLRSILAGTGISVAAAGDDIVITNTGLLSTASITIQNDSTVGPSLLVRDPGTKNLDASFTMRSLVAGTNITLAYDGNDNIVITSTGGGAISLSSTNPDSNPGFRSMLLTIIPGSSYVIRGLQTLEGVFIRDPAINAIGQVIIQTLLDRSFSVTLTGNSLGIADGTYNIPGGLPGGLIQYDASTTGSFNNIVSAVPIVNTLNGQWGTPLPGAIANNVLTTTRGYYNVSIEFESPLASQIDPAVLYIILYNVGGGVEVERTRHTVTNGFRSNYEFNKLLALPPSTTLVYRIQVVNPLGGAGSSNIYAAGTRFSWQIISALN